ncbi:MAG: glutaredoxin family protein [Cyanobacteriota bacterium]|mgnify:CR=1 FL=1
MDIIEIFSKENCQLCDEAKNVIKKVKMSIEFDFIEIDITKDKDIFEKYKYDIPVIHLNGVIAFKHRLNEVDLKNKILSRKNFILSKNK